MVITPFKVIQGHRFWYQSKAHMQLPITATVIAQDYWRPCVPCCRHESLEQAAAGDHVTVVFTHIQACTEDGTVPPMVWRCTSPPTAKLTYVTHSGPEVFVNLCRAEIRG